MGVPKGGTLILVRKNIKACEISIPDDVVEGTFIKIQLNNHVLTLESVNCQSTRNFTAKTSSRQTILCCWVEISVQRM